MSRSGERYHIHEWNSLSSEEKDIILQRSGPAYTEEAWKKNHVVNTKPRKFVRR